MSKVKNVNRNKCVHKTGYMITCNDMYVKTC